MFIARHLLSISAPPGRVSGHLQTIASQDWTEYILEALKKALIVSVYINKVEVVFVS